MMDEPKPTGWAQRLQDWENTAPARPGEGPAPAFWDRLEQTLPPAPPKSNQSGLRWLWVVLGLLLVTHFTCFQPELGYFPLPDTVVVRSAEGVMEGERGGERVEKKEGEARQEPRLTDEGDSLQIQNPDGVGIDAIANTTTGKTERDQETDLAAGARPEPRATDGGDSLQTQEPGGVGMEAIANTTTEGTGKDQGEELATDARREPRLTDGGDTLQIQRPSRVGMEATAKANTEEAERDQGEELATGARQEPRLTDGRDTLQPQKTEGPDDAIANTTIEDTEKEKGTVQVESAEREPRTTGVQFWVGPHYAPISNRTRITIDPGVLTASRTRQTLAPELGINGYLQLVDHWGLRVGFTSARVETESQYRFIRFFNPNLESPNTDGDGLSKYNVDVASPYTKSSAEVELLRPRDRMLQNGARLRIDLRIRETVTLQSIPLQVTYTHRWGRFGLAAQFGPEWTNVSVQDFVAGARVQQPGLQANRVRIQSRERISRNSYWSLSGGLAATYQLGDRWRIGVTPEFTTSLEDLSVRPEFSTRSRSAGVRLEAAYRLAGH